MVGWDKIIYKRIWMSFVTASIEDFSLVNYFPDS